MAKHALLPLSITELNEAWTTVWQELETLGFSSPRLAKCQVYLGVVSGAYGYQYFRDLSDEKQRDKPCGDIVLPRVSFSHFSDYFRGEPKASPLDTLRHEYGHAFADVNRRRVETKRFEKAFGWPHEMWWGESEMVYDPEHHVTEYASTDPAEDFAEIFWLYLKHQGKLPKRLDTPTIQKKWKFVESLRKR